MSSSLKSITLLLVEDDPSLQEGVRDLLEIADFEYDVEVLTADDGINALEVMREKEPDLIISDIMMPRMGGFEFLTEVRRHADWIHVPFIFVTAKGKRQDILEGRLSGAEMYITKPFDTAELIDMIKIQLDRSMQKKAVRREQMDSLKRSILQVLNHEFRTPLTYVTAYYEMLASSVSVYKDTENMAEYLRGIRGGCERMSDLVEDLIQVTDIRSGETFKKYDEKAVLIENPSTLIHQALKQMKPTADQKRTVFEVDIQDDLPFIYGLQQELIIALRHVIENAIKFSHSNINQGERGRIKVHASANRKTIKIVIADNGIGIPAQALSNVFDLFMQHNREKYEQQGSGSGLTIVRGIIEAHGGKVEIESEVDQGTTVSINIPFRDKVDHQDIDLAQKLGTINYHRQTAKILLVEDDYSVLDSLQELLGIYSGPYDLVVATARDGLLGLAEIEREIPDLIISDVMMPNMDGFEFVQKIRKNPLWVHIPIIFLSARTERHEIMRGRRVGAEEYVTKPYDSEEMLSLVTAMLNRHFQLQNVVDSDFEKFKISILSILRPDFLGSLASVSDYSSLISNGVTDVNTSKDLREALRGIQAGSQRISELVDDFITLAEIKTGETETAFRSRAYACSDLSILIEDIVNRRSDQSDGHALIYHFIPGRQHHHVIIDLEAFERAIKRLLDVVELNCIKGGGSTVYIETDQVGDELVIQIWQDGLTLDLEGAATIQDSLEQEEETGEGAEVEYGPRLRIVQNIVGIHGGRMTFQNGHKPDGSLTADTFIIHIPTVEDIPSFMPDIDLSALR